MIKNVLKANGSDIDNILIENEDSLKQLKSFSTGGIAGVVAKTTLAPLARVTILMQVQSMRPHKYHQPGVPNNTRLIPSLVKIGSEEGLLSFWKGNLAACCHRFPYSGCIFYTHSYLTSIYEPYVHGSCLHLLSAGSAAAVAASVAYPLDIAKTRLTTQTTTRHYTGILDCIKRITYEEGFVGLYKGLVPSLFTVIPSIGISFQMYANLKKYFGIETGLNAKYTIISGSISGFIAACTVFPFDLIRRQMQMDGLHGRPRLYTSSLDCAKHVIQTDGYRGLYRGLVPELCKVVPYVTISFLCFEFLKNSHWPGETLFRQREL